MKLKVLLLIAPAALLCGSGEADVALSPGLWETMNTPGTATLNGKALSDLPLSVLEPERICLTPAQAREPAHFLLGDIRPDCRITRSSASGGRLGVRATCPGEGGYGDATLSLAGRFNADGYRIQFKTTSQGSNGRMTFSGKLSGRRIGECGSK